MSVFKHLVFSLLPNPQKLNDYVGCDDLVYRLGYGLFWIKLRITLAVWHHQELIRCDPGYADREAEFNLARARMEAHEKGISASDPRYPTLYSIMRKSD